ncbi:MAG: amidohydrolase family protein, partial [Cohaesibacter sp.]|nr:amidohydrolase family protein [Cohaesibacter sp.]
LLMFDLVISNATIIDGTGADRYLGNVCILDDKIAAIMTKTDVVPDARQHIDGQGLILSPGFIDVHTHDDIALIVTPDMQTKVSQGVTSVIVGLCGYSPAPFLPKAQIPEEYSILIQNDGQRFERFSAFLKAVEEARPAVNYLALVGHSTLRLSVMERLDRAANKTEIAQMAA